MLTYGDLPNSLPQMVPNTMYMTLIDDYSHHCTLKLLEKKSDASQKIKDYLTSILVQIGNMPKAMQTDNGGKFVNGDLKSRIEN